MRVPRATAVDYAQMHSALMLSSGIHITHTNHPSGEIQEQIWALPRAGQWLVDQPNYLILWDIEAKRFIQLNKDTGVQETATIPEASLPGLKKTLASLFGLLPDSGRLPSEAKWNPAP